MKWEYLSFRFSYKDDTHFQNIEVDGDSIMSMGVYLPGRESDLPSTLPENLQKFGENGWELVSHAINTEFSDENKTTTWHYMHFKRPKVA
jgi:hypothetical protein